MYHIEPLDLIINNNIPGVYAEGNSWLEAISLLTSKVKDIIDQTNAYFGVDLETYVLTLMTEWEADGTLQVIITQAMQDQIDTVLPKMAQLPVDVKSYSAATGDGVTNDTTAIQAALTYAGANGLPVYIPEGVYLVTTLSMAGCQKIFGAGAGSVIKSISDASILTVTDDNTLIEDLSFLGQAANTAQNAIKIDGVYFCTVQRCLFDLLGKAGIYITNTGLSRYGLKDGARITGCKFYRCVKGIFVDTNGEYVYINDCLFHNQCGWGIWTVAGNTMINACAITKCKNGIYIGNAGNGGHGVVSNTTVNHTFTDAGGGSYTTGFAVICQTLDSSERFIGCCFFDGSISLSGCTGVEFTNCQFDIYQWLFDGSTGCKIHDSVIGINYNHVDPAQYIQNTYNAHESAIFWFDNSYVSGSMHAGTENIRCAQVVGTLPGTQTIATGANAVLDLDAYVNCANNIDTPVFASWWNASTNKAKNLFGNNIKAEIQLLATFGAAADKTLCTCYLVVGAVSHLMTRIDYGANSSYYTFNGEIKSIQNDDVYLIMVNASGQTVTLSATDGRVMIEGL